jgi:hypothetical protein
MNSPGGEHEGYKVEQMRSRRKGLLRREPAFDFRDLSLFAFVTFVFAPFGQY